MCVSRFYEVLSRDGPAWVEVEDVDHVATVLSLIHI